MTPAEVLDQIVHRRAPLKRHRHDFVHHHDNPGERVYLCGVCGKVYSVAKSILPPNGKREPW